MRLVVALLLALLALPLQAADYAPRQAIAKAVEGYIRPGFSQLAEEAGALKLNVVALCASPSETALALARAQFKSALTAYSRIEFVRLGPLGEANRAERLLFWPDRKGIALKQVQAILAEEDERATELSALRAKSVAVQGLGALEFVLFGTGAEGLARADGAFRCRYAHTIAAALVAVSGELVAAWMDPEGLAQRMLAPGPANSDFRSEREVLETLVGVLSHGVEAIRDTRLLPFLGRDGAAPKPKSALFWRSEMSVPAIVANFAGLAELFSISNIALATAPENLWVDDSTRFEFGNAARAGALVTLPVEAALADPRQKQALGYMVLVSQSLQVLVGENLAAALGLSVGFSSLDGD